jgi:hypothetical protein
VTPTYKLKTVVGQFNSHASKYSESQIEFIKDVLADYLYFFGYTDLENSNTAFFHYPEHTVANRTQQLAFRRFNSEPRHGNRPYRHGEGPMVDFMNPANVSRYTEAVVNWTRKNMKK